MGLGFRLLEEVAETELSLELGSKSTTLLITGPERTVVDVGGVLSTVRVTGEVDASLDGSGHLGEVAGVNRILGAPEEVVRHVVGSSDLHVVDLGAHESEAGFSTDVEVVGEVGVETGHETELEHAGALAEGLRPNDVLILVTDLVLIVCTPELLLHGGAGHTVSNFKTDVGAEVVATCVEVLLVTGSNHEGGSAVGVVEVRTRDLIVARSNIGTCDGRNSTFHDRAVRHDAEVRLRATYTIEVKLTEADGLLVGAVEGQAQTERSLFIREVPVLDGGTINRGITEWGELQFNVVFASELLLGGGRSGKQGNQCQGGQDVLHLEVSNSFPAARKGIRAKVRNISTLFPQQIALSISKSTE